MLNLNEIAAHGLRRVRSRRPLVHNITNWVVTNVTANALLSLGASPVMAHAHEEAADMARLAQALVLNIGTLTPYTVEAMRLAGLAANSAGVPVVLDPVGYGATELRTSATRELLSAVKCTVIRGNAAEVAGLGGLPADIQGVDARGAAPGAAAAVEVARQFGLTAAVTGATDYVSDGERTVKVDNGHRWLTLVTGSGCMASALVGAFAAVEPDPVLAAAAALTCFGVAAELAAEGAGGPGSFAVRLIDRLHDLDGETVAARARIDWVS